MDKLKTEYIEREFFMMPALIVGAGTVFLLFIVGPLYFFGLNARNPFYAFVVSGFSFFTFLCFSGAVIVRLRQGLPMPKNRILGTVSFLILGIMWLLLGLFLY